MFSESQSLKVQGTLRESWCPGWLMNALKSSRVFVFWKYSWLHTNAAWVVELAFLPLALWHLKNICYESFTPILFCSFFISRWASFSIFFLCCSAALFSLSAIFCCLKRSIFLLLENTTQVKWQIRSKRNSTSLLLSSNVSLKSLHPSHCFENFKDFQNSTSFNP